MFIETIFQMRRAVRLGLRLEATMWGFWVRSEDVHFMK
jgi:hypothetical protein